MVHQDVVLAKLSSGKLTTRFGEFDVSVFHDGHEEALVLSMGALGGEEHVICRIHSECISSHVFFADECDCSEQMVNAQRLISEQKLGLIIYLRQEGRGSGAAAHVSTLDLKHRGIPQHEAYLARGYRDDIRAYDIAAKVVHFLQIRSICLLSANVQKKADLERFGVTISSCGDLGERVVRLDRERGNIVAYAGIHKQEPLGRHADASRILVIGDFNVDYLVSQASFGAGGIVERPEPIVGGTAVNAGRTFKAQGFYPILFGKIGRDSAGTAIIRELESARITALLGESPELSTGECTIIYFSAENKRVLIKEDRNANDYDLKNLGDALKLAQLDENDMVFLVGHEFVRSGSAKVRALLQLLKTTTGAPIILDVVPHNMYERVARQDFADAISTDVTVLLGEFRTFMGFLGEALDQDARPDNTSMASILDAFPCKILVLRYGRGDISRQTVIQRQDGGSYQILEEAATGYDQIPDSEKRGFGDKLTAELLKRFHANICEPAMTSSLA